MFLELGLLFALGCLGSFGHCVGMCGPVVVAMALGQRGQPWPQRLRQQLALHLGRLTTYAAVGAVLGQAGSVLAAGGQLVGIGSAVRQGVTVLVGLLLLLGAGQPRWGLPLPQKWPQSPLGLGLLWGLIPCGFLYAAQLQAVASMAATKGALLMLAFGLGTVPVLLGLGLWLGQVSTQAGQRLNRWARLLTLLMGGLMLARTDAMVDVTGYGSLLLLGLALIARPMQRLWPGLRAVRRELGVAAFVLALVHTFYRLDHTFQWDIGGVWFLPQSLFWGVMAGVLALGMMLPLAITSTDGWVHRLGPRWHQLHQWVVAIWLLAAVHVLLLMGYRWGSLGTAMLIIGIVSVLLVRQRWWWRWWRREQWYEPAAGER
ncbi:MAG: sulfite exporter TauE/SafE family protein [Gloeomargarita sp. SKYB31]|nr:sulfite exporter TauE/SafE family protein [Gloeomargarita sp. SKYB31]